MRFKEVFYMCTRLHQENVFKTMLVEKRLHFPNYKAIIVAGATNIQLKGFVELKPHW
jgi:hypothetical protein